MSGSSRRVLALLLHAICLLGYLTSVTAPQPAIRCTSRQDCLPIGGTFCWPVNGSCLPDPGRLGDPCFCDSQCRLFDVWSACINDTCRCAPPYVDRGGVCFCDSTPGGLTVSILILIYTGVAVLICLAVIGTIVWSLRRSRMRFQSRGSTGDPGGAGPADDAGGGEAGSLSVSYRSRSRSRRASRMTSVESRAVIARD